MAKKKAGLEKVLAAIRALEEIVTAEEPEDWGQEGVLDDEPEIGVANE